MVGAVIGRSDHVLHLKTCCDGSYSSSAAETPTNVLRRDAREVILKRQVETDRVFHEREGETERELERASAQLVTPHALSQTPSRRTYSPQIGVFRNRALPRAEVPSHAAFCTFYFPSSNHDSSSSSPHALFAALPFVAGRCPSGLVWVRVRRRVDAIGPSGETRNRGRKVGVVGEHSADENEPEGTRQGTRLYRASYW